jgi:hypothetical protein
MFIINTGIVTVTMPNAQKRHYISTISVPGGMTSTSNNLSGSDCDLRLDLEGVCAPEQLEEGTVVMVPS